MKIKALTSATLIAVASMSSPAMAVEKGDWLVRAGWTMVSPKSNNHEIVRVDDASSLGLNFSYFMTSSSGAAAARSRAPSTCPRP